MGDTFDMQRRYFTAQMERLGTSPGLNREMIADCERHLEMLEEAGDLERFMERVKETGNMVSTAKAESADRIRNRRRVYGALGQQRKVRAEDRRLEAVRQAATHQELAQRLEELEQGEEGPEFLENKAIMAVGSIMSAVFQLATDPPGSAARQRNLANLGAYWTQLQEADPEASWERLVSYPPYRDRIVFTGGQLETLRPVFEEARNG